MILKMFTVYDAKTEAYLSPFFMRSKGEAMRSFEEAANDVNHAFFKHASDYTLFEIGQFDDNNCTIETHSAVIPLGLALEFKRQQPLPLDQLNLDAPFAQPNSGEKPNA